MSSVWSKYNVKKKPIGQGKQGKVYKGYDAATNKEVAIKKMRDFQRAEKEAAVMKELGSHPYFPEFYDLFIDDNRAYIVMEWINGETLKSDKKKRYSEKQAIRITMKILDAIHYLHEKGFLHSDLNRGNIMLLEANQSVKIIDFECVKILKGHDNNLKSKNNYLPFHLFETEEEISEDLNKMAILCVFLLTGRKYRSYRKILKLEMENKKLQEVLSKAFHRKRKKHYLTAKEMADALRPFVI